MNREIKFRFWDTKSNEYTEPHDIAINGSGDLMWTWNEYIDDDQVIVEQFTGFTDKNGEDIYEGDIVIDGRGRRMAVVFREHKQTLELEALTETNFKYALIQGWTNNQNSSARDMVARVEIIGNIHENPELLEDLK